MPNNLAVSYGQPSGYPNPTFFLGSFATDPVNTSPGQWWYNTTSMEIKANINGSVQILGAFASSFSSTTYITQDTTIGGQGITVNYVDVVVTNNATLTIASGSNVNVAGTLNITAGASLVMQGATLNIYNALQNAGTFQSTSSSDSIQAVQVQNTGVMQINGTLYLPNAGYNHILAGTINGTGTLNIQGTAITLIGDQLSLSIPTVSGSGTYQVQQNGVCTINGNVAMSLANVTGTGTVSVPSGYTLTFSGSNLIPSSLTVSGTLSLANNYTLVTNITNPTGTGIISIGSGYTLTVSSNLTVSVSIGGSGTLSIASGYTMTFSGTNLLPSTLTINGTLALLNNYTIPTDITVPNGSGTIDIGSYTLTIAGNVTIPTSISGTGTVSISSGYTLTVGGNVTYSVSTVSGAGTLIIASGYTLTFSGSTLSPTTLTVSGTLALSGNYTLTTNIPNISGSLVINSGYTLTVASNITLAYTSISGAGTLSVSSGYTLTIGSNITFSGITVAGAGTLSISSGYTLTQGGPITLAISTVKIAGTWANAGYNITIPSGSTVTWNLTGSFTTASTAGTLTVNGTLYWLQSNLLPKGASSTFPSFPLTLAGTGIMIAGYNFESNAFNTVSLSSTAITAGSTDGSSSASHSGYEYYNLSAIEGSAVGLYCLATYNGSSYYQNALIYIGTANTSYSVSTSYYWSNYYDPSSGTIYAANLSGSAGKITLTGTLYV